jgi:uncharacterized protein YodC (DUF2158 family)
VKFESGDVVNRKIGGPLMTVEYLTEGGYVSVVWFDVSGHVQRDAFVPATLQKWKLADEI